MRLIDADLAIAEVQRAMSESPSITRDDWRAIIEALSEVPPAQPKRKRGEWVVTSEFKDCRYAKCSRCKVTQVFYYNKPLTNYCPYCGADMR